MRRLRFLPEGHSLVEVTCRTIHGRSLLQPSPELTEIILGVLGRVQKRYRVGICGFAVTVANAAACRANPLFSDGFENGNLATWSGTTP